MVKLLALLTTSMSLTSLAKALAAAQGELTDAAKTSTNPGFKSKYADLAEVLQTVRPVLSKHGLSVVQGPGSYTKELGTVAVTTVLLHSSGEFIQTVLQVPVTKPDAQGVGGAITYGRRYSLAAMVGIAQDDDDGNTAVGRGNDTGAPTKAKASKAKGESPPADVMDVAALKLAFEAATNEELPKLAPHFASQTPDDQTELLPFVKAARKRLGLG